MLKRMLKRILKIKKQLILAGIWLFFLQISPVLAEEIRYVSIQTIQGIVEVRQNNGDWKPAQNGTILYQHDEIRTGKGAYAQVLIDRDADTGSLEIKEKTRMRFNTLEKNKQTQEKTTLLDVAIGRIMVHVEKLKGASRFEANTATTTMGVRGTTIEVIVTGEKTEEKSL